jgi:hypothetical protein
MLEPFRNAELDSPRTLRSGADPLPELIPEPPQPAIAAARRTAPGKVARALTLTGRIG